MDNTMTYYKGFYKTNKPGALMCCGKTYSVVMDSIEKNIYKKEYRIGHEHRHNGPVKMCVSGLHCCSSLSVAILHYSDISHCVYCIVQPGGRIEPEKVENGFGPKICCSRLFVQRRLTRRDVISTLINELYSDNIYIMRKSAMILYELYYSLVNRKQSELYGGARKYFGKYLLELDNINRAKSRLIKIHEGDVFSLSSFDIWISPRSSRKYSIESIHGYYFIAKLVELAEMLDTLISEKEKKDERQKQG